MGRLIQFPGCSDGRSSCSEKDASATEEAGAKLKRCIQPLDATLSSFEHILFTLRHLSNALPEGEMRREFEEREAETAAKIQTARRLLADMPHAPRLGEI
jgi:hypothetical protein